MHVFLCKCERFCRSRTVVIKRLHGRITTSFKDEVKIQGMIAGQGFGCVKECQDSAGRRGCDREASAFSGERFVFQTQTAIRPYVGSDRPRQLCGLSSCFRVAETANSDKVRNPNKLMRRRK